VHNASLELAQRRANATFVILARNSDLDNTVRSIRRVEDRFNTRHHYPYVLLNDEPFTDEFKKYICLLGVPIFQVLTHLAGE
jgi:alpha 1,2-mannosyltransferase